MQIQLKLFNDINTLRRDDNNNTVPGTSAEGVCKLLNEPTTKNKTLEQVIVIKTTARFTSFACIAFQVHIGRTSDPRPTRIILFFTCDPKISIQF